MVGLPWLAANSHQAILSLPPHQKQKAEKYDENYDSLVKKGIGRRDTKIIRGMQHHSYDEKLREFVLFGEEKRKL